MHRDAEYWGADVEEWRPERFDRRKLGKDYLPFNGGPRCVSLAVDSQWAPLLTHLCVEHAWVSSLH